MNADVAERGTRHHPVATRDTWIVEREKLLAREKELTRLRDLIARERRALPWVQIDKSYVFETTRGARALAELFDGRRQLLVQHFMFGPGWSGATGRLSGNRRGRSGRRSVTGEWSG